MHEQIPSLVLCHTILHDAFRRYPKPTVHQIPSRFIIRYIIEKTSSEMECFSATTKKTLDDIFGRIRYFGYPGVAPNMRRILEVMMTVYDTIIENKNEEIVAVCDFSGSRSARDTILVSNMGKMVRHTLKFYNTNETTRRVWKENDINVGIPFNIKTASEVEKILRKVDKKICDIVDEQLKKK